MSDALLEVRDLVTAYGRMAVLHQVSLKAHGGQIVAVLGANGAGKTTTLRALAGALRPRSGSIRFAGQEIAHMPLERRVREGIALVPEGRELFPSLTVLENLRMGAFLQQHERTRTQAAYDEVFNYFPTLYERRHARAATLSGGEGQMLAIGRALMAQPRLLLLDEPSHGLAPLIVAQIFDVIGRLVHERGLTIVLVEQSAGQALSLASFCYVLETGHLALQGTPANLQQDTRVRALYLGG
jgi:branched-chain amino acid transport system ATP-binding protein